MRITVRTKMLAGFSVVLMLMLTVGWIGLSGMVTVCGLVMDMYESQLMPAQDLAEATSRLHQMRIYAMDYIWTSDPARRTDDEKKLLEHQKLMLSSVEKYGRRNLSEKERSLLATFNSSWPIYKVELDRLLQMGRDGADDRTLARQLDLAREKLPPAMDAIQRLGEEGISEAEEANAKSISTDETARRSMIALLVVALAASAAIAFYLSGSISRAVRKVAVAAEGLAGGDTDQEVGVDSNDELGDMARSFALTVQYMRSMAATAERIAEGDLTIQVKPLSEHDTLGIAFEKMIDGLRATVTDVATTALALGLASRELSLAAEQSGSATTQIASTMQQVAMGSQDQSAAIVETTGSVDQLTRAIAQIARGAQEQARAMEEASTAVSQLGDSIYQAGSASREVSNAAQGAQDAATSGVQSVRRTVEGMQSIRMSTSTAETKVQELGSYSDQIGSIVETIDDIAAQTNLLALNAAIEAARAGENGRGFAVVAEEVRKLAERSSRSTKEIAVIIAQIQRGTQEAVAAMAAGSSEVEDGARQAQQAGEDLRRILAAVETATGQVTRIAAAVRDMETASQQVVGLVESVSAVVQESAASTQQMAASSQEVTSTIGRVAGVSEQSNAAAQEISASTEEMSAQIEEMVANARTLSLAADSLRASVASFRLKKTGLHCWDIMRCSREIQAKCPAYRSEEDRCWLISGTWCGGTRQGDYRDKTHKCMNCEAFGSISGMDGAA